MIETLTIGLEERSKKKDETIALISKEEAIVPTILSKSNPIAEAEASLKQGKNLEALIKASSAVEVVLRQILELKGIPKTSGQSFGKFIIVAKDYGLLNSADLETLRLISFYRNNAIHLGVTPDQKTLKLVLENSKKLIITLQKVAETKQVQHKKSNQLWKPLPNIKFNVAQRLQRILNFPQVGWEAYNDSPYQLRVRIEVHPILGDRDLHPLSDNDLNGNSIYEVEPNSYVFANGCFTLPSICATSKDELILEIRATVEDINDLTKSEYKLIARRWKYVRENSTWSYYPQQKSAR